jgi:alkanesulfonate monooxygenase SsuD/methylene tetrahydromethanopterin reductase-like flavin-dependent oxidoreductase (luciferase family)
LVRGEATSRLAHEEELVELGVQGLNAKATLGPAMTRRIARRSEEMGYSSWWAGEHVVLPSPRTAGSPMDPRDPILDPLVHLSYVAACTETMELGTAVVILPQRNPVVLAKQVASLDVLSGGRLLLGVGAGYLEPEMTAVGVPLSERGGRTDEYLDAMTERSAAAMAGSATGPSTTSSSAWAGSSALPPRSSARPGSARWRSLTCS